MIEVIISILQAILPGLVALVAQSNKEKTDDEHKEILKDLIHKELNK